MNDYRKILDESYAVCRSLSLSKIDNILLTDAFKTSNINISLWRIYEVVLTIYCFTSRNKGILRKFIHGCARRYIKAIKRILKPIDFNDQEIVKLHSNSNTILFLGFTKYLAKENFLPLYELIRKEGLFTPIIITDSNIRNFCIDENFVIDINNLCNNQIKSEEDMIRASLQTLIKDLRYKFRRNGSPTSSLKDFESALSFIHTYADEVVPIYLSVAHYILIKYPPKIIVSIDVADPRTRIFTLLANQLNIPVVQIQAGPIDDNCVEWRFVKDDWIFANGRKGQVALEGQGVAKDQILVVGSAKHEGVLAFKNFSSLLLRERFRITQSNKIVLLLSSYTETFSTNSKLRKQYLIFEKMLNAIINGIAERSNIVLVIKPHPLEKTDKLNKIARKQERVYVTGSKENTTELIACADAVISYGSTSTLDALLLAKLTICPQFEGWVGDYFQNSGAVMVPRNEEEFDYVFDKIEQNRSDELLSSLENSRLKFMEDVSFGMGSGASRRIVDNIYLLSTN